MTTSFPINDIKQGFKSALKEILGINVYNSTLNPFILVSFPHILWCSTFKTWGINMGIKQCQRIRYALNAIGHFR